MEFGKKSLIKLAVISAILSLNVNFNVSGAEVGKHDNVESVRRITRTEKKDGTCLICEKNQPDSALSCGHTFCSGCCDAIIKDTHICPSCKKIVLNGNKYRLVGDECVICLEKLENGEIQLPCGHSFHCHCIEDWLNTKQDNAQCPYCRTNLSEQNKDEIKKLTAEIEKDAKEITGPKTQRETISVSYNGSNSKNGKTERVTLDVAKHLQEMAEKGQLGELDIETLTDLISGIKQGDMQGDAETAYNEGNIKKMEGIIDSACKAKQELEKTLAEKKNPNGPTPPINPPHESKKEKTVENMSFEEKNEAAWRALENGDLETYNKFFEEKVPEEIENHQNQAKIPHDQNEFLLLKD